MKPSDSKKALITGGAGFIGTNVASRLLESGADVTVYDNLSRPGVERNLRWLEKRYGDRVMPVVADVRDREALRTAVQGVDLVFHFAAQVAVTTSLDDPCEDFDVNARGTLCLLEELRRLANPPSLLFTSTNKVYGELKDVSLSLEGDRYVPSVRSIKAAGFSEERCLDFHTPYGCSKGTADQYVVDYARTFGLKAVVFRMSCIYGPHQCGTEDQGWVAHFLMQALKGKQIRIFGDGRQVRDMLFVEDLVDAMLLAQSNAGNLAGKAFNMGGGPRNALSLLELLALIGKLNGKKPEVAFLNWRPGDQRYFVTDTRRFSGETGWIARHSASQGVRALWKWLQQEHGQVQQVPTSSQAVML